MRLFREVLRRNGVWEAVLSESGSESGLEWVRVEAVLRRKVREAMQRWGNQSPKARTIENAETKALSAGGNRNFFSTLGT